MSLDSRTFFTKMIDDLVEYMDQDPELADGLRWADEQAQKKGISFYDECYHLLYNYDVKCKAKDWLQNKGIKGINEVEG